MKDKIINWLREITGYFELSKELNNRLLVAHDEIDLLNDKLMDLIKNNNELKTKYEVSKAEIEKLIKNKYFDVNEFKNWYENKFGSANWTYNFRGKGYEDVRLAFRFKDPKKHTLVRELNEQIINRYNINDDFLPHELIERVKQWFCVRGNWTYLLDHINDLHPGTIDYWQEIDVSIERKKGDCEDLALLMHMLIRDLFDLFGYEEHKWRLKLCASGVLGEGGHAYNIWLHNDGEWYVIESTYDLFGNFQRAWLKSPMKNYNLYRSPWGFARPDRSFRGSGLSSLDNYRGV